MDNFKRSLDIVEERRVTKRLVKRNDLSTEKFKHEKHVGQVKRQGHLNDKF